MKYRIVFANYTVTVESSVFDALVASMNEGAAQWKPMMVSDGKWIVPAHVLAIEAVTIVDAPPQVLTQASEV